MDHNQWLAKNSIDCAPLGARISMAQCKANHGHTFACEDCPHGGVKFVGPAKVVKPNRNQLPPAPDEQTATVPVMTTKEKIMSKLPKGTCPTCKRPDVTLTQTKIGDCFRCYDRIKKGKDPVTGQPVTAQKAAEPQPPAATHILPGEVAQGKEKPPTCHIDPVQIMDAAWLKTRTAWVKELSEAPDPITRLRLAANMLESMNTLVV